MLTSEPRSTVVDKSKHQHAAAAAAAVAAVTVAVAVAVAVVALPAQAKPPALLFRTVGKLAVIRKAHAECPFPIG